MDSNKSLLQDLLQLAATVPHKSVVHLLVEAMKRMDESGLEHMRAVAADAGLRISSTDDRVSRGRLHQQPNKRTGDSLLRLDNRTLKRSKPQALITARWVSLSEVSMYAPGVLAAALFPFLPLKDHMRLACTCRSLLSASGLPPPPVPVTPRPAAWRKAVSISREMMTRSELQRLCSFALLISLSLETDADVGRYLFIAIANVGYFELF